MKSIGHKLVFKCILIVINSLFIFSGNAQLSVEWNTEIGSVDEENLYDLKETFDGGFIVASSSNGNISGEKTQNNKGGKDYWVVKFDQFGNKQWDISFGGDDDDELYSINQTQDSGYILAGSSLSGISGDKTEPSKDIYGDCWILKIDKFGVIEWQKTIGGTLSDYPSVVQQTMDGGYLIGATSVSDSSGNKTEKSFGYFDFWLIKLDQNGNNLWQKVIKGSAGDFLTKVEETPQGEYILAGTTMSGNYGDKSEVNPGYKWAYWVLKLDNSRNIIWETTIGGDKDDFLNSMIVTNQGGCILLGSSNSDISGKRTVQKQFGRNDGWFVHLDSNGTIVAQKSLPIRGSFYSFANTYTLHQTNDNNYIGVSGGPSWHGIKLFKLNTEGECLCTKNIIHGSETKVRSIIQTKDNGFVIGYNFLKYQRSEEFGIIKVSNFDCFTYEDSICQGDSILFNNEYLSATGLYKDTLVDQYGSDSVVKFKLTVIQSDQDTIRVNLCTGKTYNHVNVIYDSAGYYTDTLTNLMGCDSLSILHLTYDAVINKIYDTICESDSSFLVDKYYKLNGIYYDTVQTSNGCDSVMVLDLFVNSISRDSNEIISCAGDRIFYDGNYYFQDTIISDTFFTSTNTKEISTTIMKIDQAYSDTIEVKLCTGDSIFFDSEFIHSEGNYTDTIQTIYGCDSILLLSVTLSTTDTTTIRANLCSQDSILFNGNYLNQSGIYIETVTSSYGCDSIIKLNLTVNPINTIKINEKYCLGDSIFFGSEYISNDGIYYDTLISRAGCDSIIELVVIFAPSSNDTIFQTICNNDSIFFANNYLSKTGVYVDSLLSSDGCDSISTLILEVNEIFDSTINTQICRSDSFYFGNNILFDSGVYYDSLTTITGCDSVITLNLSIMDWKMDTISTQLCAGDSILFNTTYLFNSGLYYDTNTCSSLYDSITVLFLTVHLKDSTIFTRTLCQGDSLYFNGYYLNSAGSYYDTLQSINGCDSILKLSIQVNSIYYDTIFDTVCANETYNFGDKKYNRTGIYHDTVLVLGSCDSIITLFLYQKNANTRESNIYLCTNDSLFINNQIITIPGTYYDTFSNSTGCDSITKYVVQYMDSREFRIQMLNEFCFGKQTTLYINESFSNIYWSFGSENNFVTIEEPGIYFVEAIDANACKYYDTISLEWENCDESEYLYIPNTFTPNNDGINDIFSIVFDETVILEEYELNIFNRWGEVIFVSKSEHNSWIGNDKTSQAPIGVYIWKLKYRTKQNIAIKEIYGKINLIR